MAVQFTQSEHIISEQYKAEKEFLAECRKGSYSFENPYVKCNPYLICPLTAIIYFTTPKAEEVSITVRGKAEAGNIHFTFAAATEHFIPVYGLYPEYLNCVELSTASGKRSFVHIQTEEKPEKLLFASKNETTPGYLQENMIFVSPTTAALPAAYDYNGDVRWYCTLNISFEIKRAKNGRLLVGSHRLFMPPYHTTGLFEIALLGKVYAEYRLPGGYHHDQIEMEDANLVVLSQDPSRGTVEDMCVLIDRETGHIIKTWDYQTILPRNVGGSGSQDAYDWFHNNSVHYDKKTHSLTLSGRHQDCIINIDYDSGQLHWILGDPETWPQEMVEKYFFTPISQEFDWQYEQHSALLLPDGDVMCFDNGHWRSKLKEKYVEAKDNFSRGVRYRINTETMEIEQLWQFGKERGKDFFSTYISNVDYYADGHYLVHSGGMGTFNGEVCNQPPTRFVSEKGDLVLHSVSVEVKDDIIMHELQLPGNFYRARKLPLYCQEESLSFGKGRLLGRLGVTERFDTIPDVKEAGEVPDKYKVKITLEEDRLVLNGTFEKGQLVMLLLEGVETHAYFVPTSKRAFIAMCVGTFLDADDRAVEFPISREGLTGHFRLFCIIDEAKYSTGIEVDL